MQPNRAQDNENDTAASRAIAKVDALRAHVYPQPVDDAPAHCQRCHGLSFWDVYAINSLTSCSGRCSSSSSSLTSDSTKSETGGWFGIMAGIALLVGAIGVAIYDASKLVVLLLAVSEADALVLPLGGDASVLFNRWKRNELVFWWIHSLSIWSTVPLLVAALVARVYFEATASIYWLLAMPALALVCGLVAYRLLGYRNANRDLLDTVAAKLVTTIDTDRKNR
ncbi:hypothetical protein pmac_cds_821 [Pandoravirus macleodensis]|uniref:Uncharacterized protein n=1 Tax=Pandoravirus macleodensis TaxID=2107707 RepID=A0A2U7UG69_9VIRU|nr:hypothetical protein pmac_cds_821 [Pandoravirus macleodensis]AVK77509.1 hypothetical protein pmac_cds_821 [Pandoravirus macleodensis]